MRSKAKSSLNFRLWGVAFAEIVLSLVCQMLIPSASHDVHMSLPETMLVLCLVLLVGFFAAETICHFAGIPKEKEKGYGKKTIMDNAASLCALTFAACFVAQLFKFFLPFDPPNTLPFDFAHTFVFCFAMTVISFVYAVVKREI